MLRLKRILIMCLILTSSGLMAQTNIEDIFRKDLEQSVQKMQSLSGEFTQIKTLSFIDNEITSTGKFNYEGETYLRWEYLEPYRYLMEIKDGLLVTFDGKNRVEMDINSSRTFKTINDVFLKSIKGDILDSEDIFESNIRASNLQYYISLSPKEEGLKKYIKEMNLVFNKESMLVEKVTIKEVSGDQMEIIFANHKVNE